jgi:AcrR family transcriptional regulator
MPATPRRRAASSASRSARPRAPAAAKASRRRPAAVVPSDDTRRRLLQAGFARVERAGLRALTVRGVAADAGVNLGSFVYHFGTREAFVAEVIEQWYAPLMSRLQLTVDEAAPPLERLRALLAQLLDFLLAHAGFIGHVLLDAAAGEPLARRFVASLAGRHPQLVLRVIGEAQRDGALPARESPLHLLMFLMGAIGAPVLVLGAAARSGLMPTALADRMVPLACDAQTVQRRIDWALRGLSQEN